MNDRPKMNQRLSAIKQQAHLYALDQEWYVDSFEQQFAELIVAECMQIIKVDMYEDAISNMWSKNKLQMIKQHFGVDE